MNNNKDTMEFIPWIAVDREQDLVKLSIEDKGPNGDHGKCAICIKTLSATDPNNLLSHVTSFCSKVEDLVLHNEDVVFDAFHRTLSSVLKTTWNDVCDAIPEGTALDMQQFCDFAEGIHC